MESLRMRTKEILEAVSGDSDTDDDEEMEPVAAIPAHPIHNFNDIHVLFQHLKIAKIYPFKKVTIRYINLVLEQVLARTPTC